MLTNFTKVGGCVVCWAMEDKSYKVKSNVTNTFRSSHAKLAGAL